MKCISLFASCFSILFPHALLAQDIVNDFSYAGVTYRYKIAPQEGRDSTYLLHIQALKNQHQGTYVYKGRLVTSFQDSQRWEVTILAASKTADGWKTLPESRLKTVYNLQDRQLTHIEIGNMSQWAEKELYEVFMGDWESIDVQTALANSVEYFILNYSKALGQHDVDGELETEETMMLNQLMATRQAARDSAIAALVSQRDQVWPHSQASQPQTKVDDSAQTSQPQTKDDNSAQSSLANISTHSSNTVGDSLQAAVQHQQIDVNSSDKEGQLPIYSDNTLSLPFVASIPVGEQTFFLEAYYDDTHRIEMKLHHYDEENDQTKLLYVTRVSIQDNAEDTRKCSVYIYMAEHSGYEWKISPSSYLECSLNQLERKICYRTVGKLLSYLRDPNKAQHQESIPAEVSQVHRKDLLLSAAKYLIKEFSELRRD